MSYIRVIPRDLFNEAKLLKCLGQIALIIHDGADRRYGLKLEHDDSECAGFDIAQNSASGALVCTNLRLTLRGSPIDLFSPYNSRDPYPLYYRHGENEDRALADDGSLSPEFVAYVKTLS